METGTPPAAAGGASASVVDRAMELLARGTAVLATVICAALILTTTFSVVVYQRGITISWLDDLLRMLLIWLVFLGSVAPVWRRDHITMDALYTRLAPGARNLVDMVIALLGLVTCAFVTWAGLATTLREQEFQTLLSSGELPAWPQTLSIPLSFGLMMLTYLGVLIAILARRSSPAGGSR